MKCFNLKKKGLLLWLFLLPAISYAQIAITGTVTDVNGEPIIGASIVEAGTRNSTVTDVDGKFSLTVANNAVLQVSFLGYVAQEIDVGNRTDIPVTLVESATEIEEVVVIGYGTVRKSDLTGSVASVSPKQFKDQPLIRVSDILQGRTAGVQVINESGEPGAGAKIRIRGTTSINASSDPLYVIDGVIGANLTNVAEIASIEVLKDASSTAIYGSRGANGVIIITTKRGTAGRPEISLETEIGIGKLQNPYEVMSAFEYAEALNDVRKTSVISDADLRAYKYGYKGIDWLDLMTQTSFSQNYRLAIAGGNNNTKYRISGNVLDQSAVVITTKYQHFQFRSNIDTQVTPWLNIESGVELARSQGHNFAGEHGNFLAILAYSPTMELRDRETGVYNMDPYNLNVAPSPYGSLTQNIADTQSNIVDANLNLKFNIVDGLTLNVQGGLMFREVFNSAFTSELSQPNVNDAMSSSKYNHLAWQNTNNLTYNKSFGAHRLTATTVLEISKTEVDNMGISGNELQTASVGYWNVGNALVRDATNNYGAESMVSGFGRVLYNYAGRYFLTATIRADGVSKFQGKNKWGYFPSGAVAWNVAEENFMKSQNIVRQLKLRASAGIAGNQAIGRYATLGGLSGTSYAYGTTTNYTGYWANSFATPDLTWEKSIQYDVGADIGVLNGQVNISIDWFLKNTTDMLSAKSIPGYNGGGAFWINRGEMENTGWEFSITAFPLKNKEIYWETTFHAAFVKNTVIDLAGDPFRISGPGGFGGSIAATSILKPGYPVGSFYLYRWTGFDENGANLYYTIDDIETINPSGDDKVVTGQSEPAWTFGWNNMLTWKNWEANIFINAATGFNRLNATRYMLARGERFFTLRDAYYKGWDKVENKADAMYASRSNTDSKGYGDSDFYLEDASFLKLKNVSISYRIPRELVKFADVRLSISVQNLLTLTKYTGMDPESVYTLAGLDWGAYPTSRTYTFSLKLNF